MKFKSSFNIYNFKLFIKKFVTIFSSREFAFVYCLLGTIGQIFHTYYLIDSVSSFDGWIRGFQAVLLSVFISSALMYFVSIADKDDEDQKEYKRIMRAVNLFMYIEILINLYYYCNHLIIIAPEIRIFDFVFGSIVSMLIPISIKLFANSIKAKQWLQEIEENEKAEPQIPQVVNDPLSNQLIDNIFTELQNRVENYVNNKLKSIDDYIQSTLKDKLSDKNLHDLVGNYSIDHELIKSSIKKDLKTYVDNITKSIKVEDIAKIYESDIMKKIEELVDKNNGEFLKTIEKNIDIAIENYTNNKK